MKSSVEGIQSCVACGNPTHHFCKLPGSLDQTGSLNKTDLITYVQCVDCGTIQQNPLPSELELSKLVVAEYSHSDDRMSSEKDLSDSTEPQHRIIVQVVAREGIRDGVLEVGTGAGNLCAYLLENGIKVAGIDLSPELVAFAKQRGLPIKQQNLKTITETETLSAIIMSHVFEHLCDPADTLKHIHNLLKAGGIFLTSQPTAAMTNLLSRVTRLNRLHSESPFGISYLNLNRWHIVIYTIRGMNAIAAKQGFDLVEVIPMPSLKSNGLIGIVRRAYQIFNTLGERIFPKRWPFHVAHLFLFRKREL